MRPDIRTYIQQNRDTSTRETIDQHLQDAGWSEPEIDAAWQSLSVSSPQNQGKLFSAYCILCLFIYSLGVICLFGSNLLTYWSVFAYHMSEDEAFMLWIVYYSITALYALLAFISFPLTLNFLSRRGVSFGLFTVVMLLLWVIWFVIIIEFSFDGPYIVLVLKRS